MSFQQHLEEAGLLPSTQKKYQEIITSAHTNDLIDWINAKVGAETPLGTVLPLRSAVRHYLLAEQGYSEDDLNDMLPETSGRKTEKRNGLTAEQLALYHAAVEQLEQEPARTILSLLPKTGMKIQEVCALRVHQVKEEGIGLPWGDYQPRIIPWRGNAKELLEAYMQRANSEDVVFKGYEGTAITPCAIRIYTREIAEKYDELEGLSPGLLRHTYAEMALAEGMKIDDLRVILGHSSIRTTRRYLKSSS